MTGRRRALVVATDTYDHAALGQLRSAAADAVALSEVLGDPEVGGFEVDVVQNAASHEVQAHIEDLFADSGPEDLVLLHFSGHGLKSDSGELFIAARNTRPDRLASSSVPADFVQRCMRGSRAHSIVLFLDCCYGGAFGEGVTVRAAGPVNVMDAFPKGRLGGGRGRAVISASSAIEYAFEGTTLTAEHEAPPSVFTSAVVHGLRTGDADRDEDGLVSLDELYDYVFDRVREANPKQTPGRDIEMSGEIYVARTRRRRLKAAPLPDALATALRNPDPTYRRGAVLDLRDRLGHPDLAVALGALEALRAVAAGDVRAVADDARAAIDAARPSVTPASLDLGELDADASVDVERTLALGGVPLAREVSVEADPPLSAEVEDGEVVVTFAPTGQPFSGTLVLTAPTGSVTVPVTARVPVIAVTPGPAGGTRDEGTTLDENASPVEARTPDGVATPVAAGTARRLVPVAPDPPAGSPGAIAASEAASPSSADEAPPQETEPPVRPPSTPGPPTATTAGAAASAGRAEGAARSHVDEPAARLRAVLGWVAVASGLLVVVGGLIAPWGAGDSAANPEDDIVVEVVCFLVLAVAAGVALLARRSSPAIGVALVFPTTTLGVLHTLGAIGLLRDGTTSAPGPGWWLSFLGAVCMVVVAVGTLLSSQLRSSVHRDEVRWTDPATIAVIVATAVGVLVLLDFAIFLQDSSAPTYWVAWFWMWAGAAAALTTIGLPIGPVTAERAWLAASGVVVLDRSLSSSLFASNHGNDPRYLTLGIVAATVVVVAALLVGRWPRATSGPRVTGPTTP
ncbi:caspase, EACC1-associated type [Intrasporangium sp. YIM S08009]|uniref:caspase, EACC1-associated type n=1 Tax=Intrasporangium zincisolvens TaxID=3080018 RepID=UPI002B053141|nr:caspase family protein [Intrasporangium sp. YIM S08009]